MKNRLEKEIAGLLKMAAFDSLEQTVSEKESILYTCNVGGSSAFGYSVGSGHVLAERLKDARQWYGSRPTIYKVKVADSSLTSDLKAFYCYDNKGRTAAPAPHLLYKVKKGHTLCLIIM
jgi:hypothetical protein